MDQFIKDITDVEEISNVRMIDYKGKLLNKIEFNLCV
jgi:hypothetical protein